MWNWTIGSFLPWASPLLRNHRAVAWVLCLGTVLVTALLLPRDLLVEGNSARVQRFFRKQDCDSALILQGVEATDSVGDTLRWWTGVWCGQVPFWRPLSSMLFWAEWRLFGYDFRWWYLASAALAVVLAALVLGALEPLLGSDGAAATVLVSFAGFTRLNSLEAPMGPVLAAWKHQVDLQCGIWLFAALWLAVRGRPLLSLVPIVLAAASKETGFIGFLLVPVVLWWWRSRGHDVPSLRSFCLAAVPIALTLGVYHWVAVGPGLRMGPNVYWFVKAAAFWGGQPTSELMGGGWHLVAMVSVGALTVWVANRRGFWAVPVFLGSASLVLVLKAAEVDVDLVTAATLYVVDFNRLLPLILWFVAAYAAWRFARPEVLLGLSVMFLGSILTFAAGQTLEHSRWLGGLGHSILAWAVIRGTWIAAPLAVRGLKEGLGLGAPEERTTSDDQGSESADSPT